MLTVTDCSMFLHRSIGMINCKWTFIYVSHQSPGLIAPFLLSRAQEGSLSSVNSQVTLQIHRLRKTFLTNTWRVSPVWTLMWRFKWIDSKKPLLQTEHLNGLSAVWNLMWRSNRWGWFKNLSCRQSTWRVSLQCGLSCDSSKTKTV